MAVPITLIGNATADPDLTFGQNGDARANFTLAVNERIKQGDEWVDGEASFYSVTAWRHTAEACAEQIRKGTRLVIVGKFKPRTYEGKTGEKRTSLDVTADTVGVVVKPQQRQTRPEPADPWADRKDDIPPF